MDIPKPNPGHLETSPAPMSPEASAEYMALQEEICEMLETNPHLSVNALDPALVEAVQVHVIACQDRIHTVDGLFYLGTQD